MKHNCIIKTRFLRQGSPGYFSDEYNTVLGDITMKLSRRHEMHPHNIEKLRKLNIQRKTLLAEYLGGSDEVFNRHLWIQINTLKTMPFRMFMGSEGLETFRRITGCKTATLATI